MAGSSLSIICMHKGQAYVYTYGQVVKGMQLLVDLEGTMTVVMTSQV